MAGRRLQVSPVSLAPGLVGLTSTPMMVAGGTSSCSSSSRFGPTIAFEEGHAGDVAARPVEAGDEAKLDRVAAVPKTIGIVVVAALAASAEECRSR